MEIGHVIKSVTTGMPVILTGGVPGERAGDERLASALIQAPRSLSIESPDFENGAAIPLVYSAEGENKSPPLQWSNLPADTQSLVLIVEDPDAPTPKPFVHWLVYGISPQLDALVANLHKAESVPENGVLQGKNSGMKVGWTGMAPPKGDLPHRYFFQLFALNTKVDLEPGVGRSALVDAIAKHVVAQGCLIGLFQR